MYHKIIKTILCLCTVVTLVWICDVPSEAEGIELESFGVDVTTGDEEFTYTVKWWRQDGIEGRECYITIPYDAKGKALKANYVSGSDVWLNGILVNNGEVIPQLVEGHNSILCAGLDYSLYVIYGSDIPTVHITTASGSMENVYEDIDYKESGYVTILSDDKIEYEGELEYIKGRGNYTWTRRKKPFNIKLKEKANLFEMGSAKKWTLLANYLDDTMLKNKLGFDFADEIGLDFSPESVLTDVYIDGEYIGNYTFSESVEVRKSRVNITDLEELNEKANEGLNLEELELGGIRGEKSHLEFGSSKWVELPNTPEVITGGYLLEFELDVRYDEEICGFVSEYGQSVNIKSPKYASREQVEYISSYYQEFEDAVLSGDGYNHLGKHYSEYIDVESFAKMYVFQEYVKNLDAGLSSFFMYKDVGGKMTVGFVWDLDSAFGRATEREGIRMDDPTGLWVTDGHLHGDLSDKYTIFALLCQHNDFKEEAKKQWNQYVAPCIDGLLLNLDTLQKEAFVSIFTDKFKWIVEGSYSEAYEFTSVSIENLRDFIIQRRAYLSEVFYDETYALEYDSNGVEKLKAKICHFIKNMLQL